MTHKCRVCVVAITLAHALTLGRVRDEEDSGVDFHEFFPNFLWIVRDFSVKLERDGRRISARDYLEDALAPEVASPTPHCTIHRWAIGTPGSHCVNV